MITKITGEQPFQVLTNNFSISPSQEGYTLQISADGVNYSNLFTVGAGVTRLVTGVAANSFYKLSGNQSAVSINWMKTCVTEGGSGGAGNELTPVTEFPLGVEAGTVVALASGNTYGIYQYDGTDWNEAGAEVDLSAYWTSAETQSAITAVEDHLFDVEQVTASALTELHDGLLEVSGRTMPDMSLYTPTSGFSTINGSAITNGGDIVIQGGGGNIVELTQQEYDNLSAYSPDTLYVISDATPINMDNYMESGDVATQIAATVSGKADAQSVTANQSDWYFPTWNSQGVITGQLDFIYQPWVTVNGVDGFSITNSVNSSYSFYAPTTYGAAGAPLLANGENNAPVWANYKFAFLTQTQYDNLATKDATTIYFIIG